MKGGGGVRKREVEESGGERWDYGVWRGSFHPHTKNWVKRKQCVGILVYMYIRQLIL